MSSITVYVIANDGTLDCRRSGDVNEVLYAVSIEKKDYTLTPPPSTTSENQHIDWYWTGSEWIDINEINTAE